MLRYNWTVLSVLVLPFTDTDTAAHFNLNVGVAPFTFPNRSFFLFLSAACPRNNPNTVQRGLNNYTITLTGMLIYPMGESPFSQSHISFFQLDMLFLHILFLHGTIHWCNLWNGSRRWKSLQKCLPTCFSCRFCIYNFRILRRTDGKLAQKHFLRYTPS